MALKEGFREDAAERGDSDQEPMPASEGAAPEPAPEGAPVPAFAPARSGEQPALEQTEDGLALVQGGMTLRADFARMLPRIKASNLSRELLVRAARIKGADGPLWAIDATAGLGDDSFLLAAAGFDVTLYERDPAIAALLADKLQRAQADPRTAGIAARMKLVEGDSIHALKQMAEAYEEEGTGIGTATQEPATEDQCPLPIRRPDVILLDPMFPAKQKSSAAKKKLQLIQQLERPCPDEDELLAAALAARPRKVVVKRPAKGAHLAGRKPDYALAGKAIRYDVIVIPR